MTGILQKHIVEKRKDWLFDESVTIVIYQHNGNLSEIYDRAFMNARDKRGPSSSKILM